MKKIKSYPWTKDEEAWLKQAIKDHPEWTNATMYNQLKYAHPYTLHTKKATASKINTLRPSRGKCKWNATAHETLRQLYTYELPVKDMATYFNVTEPAIVHQLPKLEKMGKIKRTPGRKVTACTRVIQEPIEAIKLQATARVQPIEVKQLNIDFDQEVVSKVKAIDVSVEKLLEQKESTATEIINRNIDADTQCAGTVRRLILRDIVGVLSKAMQLLEV